MSTVVVRSLAEFMQWRDGVDQVAVVLTMGALHDGHASLIRVAQHSGLPVVLTIFVNPTQFGPNEDLDRYPRTEAADINLAEALGVECVWLPQVADIYPSAQPVASIEPGRLGSVLEGAVRPGHFAGVLTVVNRFLDVIRPSIAVFGKKDRQQLILIESMVSQRGLEVEIVAAETVREPDGLAMSSRNRYLSPADRVKAASLSRALAAVAKVGADGDAVAAREAGLNLLHDIDVDYLVITDPHLEEVTSTYRGPAIALVAGRIGTTRLIDNIDLQVHG